MTNVLSVLLASLGVFGAVWGASGSVRAAAAIAGATLAVAAVVFLFDFEGA